MAIKSEVLNINHQYLKLEVWITLLIFLKYTNNLVRITSPRNYTKNLLYIFKSPCVFFLIPGSTYLQTFFQIKVSINWMCRSKVLYTSFSYLMTLNEYGSICKCNKIRYMYPKVKYFISKLMKMIGPFNIN